MCGFAPYGYLKSKTEKNRIVVDEATAGNVRLIYKLFLDGKGYTPIAKYLNEQGIMSPLMYLKSLGYQQNVRTNGVWTKTTVKSILTNQAYIGSAVHGKVVIEKYNNIPLHAKIQVNGSLLKIRMSRLSTKRHLKRHRKE